jgi:outer membrane protein
MQIKIGILNVLLCFQFAFSQSIDLDSFLEMVRQNHPVFKETKLSPEIQRMNKQKVLASQDWRVQSRPSFAYSKPISTSPFTPTRVTNATINTSLNKNVWSTGGQFSVGWTSNLTDQDLPSITFPTLSGRFTIPTGLARLYKHTVSLNYSQPLLQNYGGTLDRLPYQLSDYTLSITELKARERQEKLLLSFGVSFLDWVLANEKIKIAKDRLQLSKEAYDLVVEKHDAYLVDKVDVLRSEDAVHIAEQTLLLFQSQEESKQAELAILAKEESLKKQKPEFSLYQRIDLPAMEELLTTLDNFRILKIQSKRKQQLETQREGFLETEKSRLNLNVGLALVGGDDYFGQSLDMTYPDFSVSLVYSYPLGNRAAELDVQKSAVQLQQLTFQTENTELDIESRLTNLWIQIHNLEKIMDLNETQIHTAEQKTREELDLYNKGKSQLTFVIQSRDNAENAKLRYAQNATHYHKMILQYKELADVLLTSRR